MLGLVRILTLVTCLPFLLPTGVCACSALAVAHADENGDEGDAPADAHDGHAPGCPKVRKLDRPAAPVTPDPVAVAFDTPPLTQALTAPSDTVPRIQTPGRTIADGTPLYVSHCALLF